MKNNYPEIRFDGYDIEWSMKKLGDITDIKDSSRISNTLWISNGVPYLRSSDLSNDNIKGELFLSRKTYQEYSAKTGAPTRGDLLFTSGGKIGVTYYKEDDDELYVQGGSILYAKTSESEHLDGRFLKSYFDTPILKKYIENASTGLTIKHFTLKPAKDTPIAIPELDEQKKIGLFFKDLDDTISLHQQELDALKQTKQGFLQRMFPKDGETIPEVRFSGFLEDWNDCLIGDVATVSMCKRIFKEQTSENGDIPFYKIGTFGKKPDSFISQELYLEYKNKYSYPNKGDILISASGTIGRTVIYDGQESYYQDSNIIWLKRKENKISNLFLYQFYKIVNWNQVEGSTIKRLYNETILSTRIKIPSMQEQIKIGTFFKQIDEVIELKEQELEALKETKKGFLQKMFV